MTIPAPATKAYEEIVDFIAAGTSPDRVITFQPSETVKARVENLIYREKNEGISSEEKAELDLYLQLEHIMRLAKARARQYVTKQ
ncbi:hypothetical protein IQ264_00790 [Phormidium sp. LEGE 05292]|uniref:hypothetical protein n=1 Tax=[Phormidium] sp. LEGE 05292 TaxID=767427 RepID=UPI0018829596|nr:hypothetical protein [Phormidium sp. LEGE 05292]MBE9224012.1 hypothetical protein [Phormidium sp. LEGE 05292]